MRKILLENAIVLTMDKEFHTYQPGFVAFSGRDIVAAGPMEALSSFGDFAEFERWDCTGKILMPGMVNTHSHLSMMVFRSLADDVPDRLKRYLFPLEQRAMTAEMAAAGAAYAAAELIMGGVTTIYDAYYFEDEIAKELDRSGLRAVLAETIIGQTAPNAPRPYDAIPYSDFFIRKWKGHDRITPSVNCHAPYTMSAEKLKESHRLAREHDVLFCMHLSEMDYEVRGCLEQYGKTPPAWLDELGILDDHFLAAHAILVTEEDMDLFAKRGVKVAHNPGANTKSAKGVAPILELRKRGIVVGLGSDGPMSGNTIDILTQMTLAVKMQKLHYKDRTLFPAREMLEMGTRLGAEALGLGDVTGSIEVGKRADLVLFETDSVNMQPLYDPYSVLIYSANPSNVDTTIVNGEVLMKNRRLLTLDLAKERARLLSFCDEISAVVATL